MKANDEAELSWFRVEIARQRHDLEAVKDALLVTQEGIEEIRQMLLTRT